MYIHGTLNQDGAIVLNGNPEDAPLNPGDMLVTISNQGWRNAYCLAVIKDRALIEYYMPNGSTSLRVINRNNPNDWRYKNISYYSCPKKWIEAMVAVDSEWEGRPQQWNPTKQRVPSVYELWIAGRKKE